METKKILRVVKGQVTSSCKLQNHALKKITVTEKLLESIETSRLVSHNAWVSGKFVPRTDVEQGSTNYAHGDELAYTVHEITRT